MSSPPPSPHPHPHVPCKSFGQPNFNCCVQSKDSGTTEENTDQQTDVSPGPPVSHRCPPTTTDAPMVLSSLLRSAAFLCCHHGYRNRAKLVCARKEEDRKACPAQGRRSHGCEVGVEHPRLRYLLGLAALVALVVKAPHYALWYNLTH